MDEIVNYERIAKAINLICENYTNQPSLETLAESVHMSPYHFQKVFTEWAGVSLKKFVQYLSLTHAKVLLKEKQSSLFDSAHSVGLSSTSRLHDLFINFEAMSPAEYKLGGKGLSIDYSYQETPFGQVLVASTDKGICQVLFKADNYDVEARLQSEFPNAHILQKTDTWHLLLTSIFARDHTDIPRLNLHLRGTPFQLKVWEALLKIPRGSLSTYGTIAKEIGQEKASRAVGTAISNNPIAYLIPCHRVIQASGAIGQYEWGKTRKAAIIGWEGARNDNPN